MTPSFLPGRFQNITRKKLLLIDADVCFGASLKEALAQVHYDVDWELDHKAALQRAQSTPYSLVLMDDHVHGTAVPELIREMQHPHKPQIIVYGTALIATEEEDCIAAGATGFLTKCTDDISSLVIKIIGLTARPNFPCDN
ncbi:Response regulator receiver domain-containing protein [Chitinophaga jiangningensis]|uniref:Response regulator receiver domain-containing protein n=1 Tax=Chitinophaga jiangningensis TaxID=1419482 RepID=A0A1M7MRD5_9BACT|nr:response regulator [Chitinophaga jiangningensis]SHM93586.1 Response regulator receiver domain-containing protein [Chitinophaga jiangningensis]